MRQLILGLIFAGAVTSGSDRAVFAQPSRRPITIVFDQAPVSKVQFSPDSGNSFGGSPNGTNPSGNGMPAQLPAAGNVPDPSQSNNSTQANNGSGIVDYSQRPTMQQMQNPGGGFQLTHTGFSQNQYTSANNYFGSQFNSWSNLRPLPTNLNIFESFNRNQPPQNTGAYYTGTSYYLGPMNNQWSNLSYGSVSANYLGSWIYQIP